MERSGSDGPATKLGQNLSRRHGLPGGGDVEDLWMTWSWNSGARKRSNEFLTLAGGDAGVLIVQSVDKRTVVGLNGPGRKMERGCSALGQPCLLERCHRTSANDRLGRKAERPVLRAKTIRRGVSWPDARPLFYTVVRRSGIHIFLG